MTSLDIHAVTTAEGYATNHDNAFVCVNIKVADHNKGRTRVTFFCDDLEGMQALALALMTATTELVAAMNTVAASQQVTA